MSLPSTYKALEYLAVESSGPYIDTGIANTSMAFWEIEAQYMQTPGNNYGIMGAQAANREFTVNTWQGSSFVIAGDTRTYFPSGTQLDRHKILVNGNGIYIDDALVGEAKWNLANGRNYYLFAINYTGGLLPTANTRIYHVKLFNGDNLVRNFIPCERISDGELGFYDDITETFFVNSGTGTFIAGPYPPDVYTVEFNANGGTGSMEDQVLERDTPTALSMCTFIAPGELSFAGWALSAAGEPVYSDGQTVTNLAAVGETVTLYAVWRAVPGFEIRIQYNASEVNRLDKEITDIMVLRGILRAESSIIDPVFMVQGSLELLAGANYLTIPIWGRKYFIRDIVSIRSNLVQISAHVDVLSSWPEELRACKGIVHRQERDWNLYLNDGTFRVYQNPDVFTQPFPSGFNAMAFVLAVAGGTGSSVAAAPAAVPEEVEPDGI